MRFVSRVDGRTDDGVSGKYLIAYDPEYHLPDGSYDGGDLLLTEHKREAADMPLEVAVAIYYSGPACQCHRLRADGMRNCPLRAWAAEFSE